MDAILTHENADLDALASLLGARKLYPDALAVLPRRLNANVRDFCALYGEALKFVHPEDLARQHWREILVVDTQGIPSARGLHRDTRIHFVDHHPLARALTPAMTYAGGLAGATTTLFVEQIQEKEIALTPLEASLLMLGIYEDTGSLVYTTTTARDARAVAWLLDQGADLAIVNDFLRHPLTPAQRKLYQQLIECIETRHIAGHAIALAVARTDEYVEEISTLAHQLRELYDPAALFVLAQMDDHIQLVARSDVEAIDVAGIAEQFGGGGHAKAAAALIRGATLRGVKTKLFKLLKATIKPAITVRELMSFGVRTLEPTATIAQADEMMHRYGHEGFPVARQGKLLGVVTRRDVDRALHHQLAHAPIKTLMRKPVFVTPDDSVESLRAVMIESDLGQVPVVNATHKKILGIVTRTDLIKPFGATRATRAAEMTARLERWLPPELLALIRDAGNAAQELGYSLYVVGGFVRDLLLNQPNLDLDLVVEGDAITLARHLAKQRGGRVHAHTRFGTAKWIVKEKKEDSGARKEKSLLAHLSSLDFTTARTEFYAHPSALPEVERSSIKQDLRRRDFTINTLAICLDAQRFGQLLDPFGGEQDLQRGWVRVLHSLSFIEDPTRILRAARFEQRFGFKIETRTAQLIGDALEMLERVSGERIRHELELIFRETEPEKAMARLGDLGVLRAIFPRLAFGDWHIGKFRSARAAQLAPLTYLALLAYDLTQADAAAFAKRLKLKKSETETIHQVLALRAEAHAPLCADTLTPSALYHLLADYADDALAIFAVATDDARVRERVAVFRERLRDLAPELTGDDLKRMGIPPGPQYREILTRLRDARLDGVIATRAEEEQWVRQLAN
ncbi:MAG: CBS domain-containing protein [Chloroflexi bacterium]|nr:CBS domain-containing protein [Chloroflexota bacterium]